VSKVTFHIQKRRSVHSSLPKKSHGSEKIIIIAIVIVLTKPVDKHNTIHSYNYVEERSKEQSTTQSWYASFCEYL